MTLQVAFIVAASCIGFVSVCKALINFVRWVWIMFLRPPKNLKDYGSWGIVTGSAQGIGKVLAFQLASKGLNLVLIDKNHSALKATCNEILEEFGGKVEVKSMVIDLTKLSGEEIANAIAEEIEELDVGVLINNAGMAYPYARFFHEVDLELMENIIKLNLGAPTWVTKAVLPGMLKKKKGAILNISSNSAHLPSFPLYTLYSTTKTYISIFSRCISLEYKQQGIDIQCQGGRIPNRLFYLSIPPYIFIDAVRCSSLSASSGNGWTRVIVEKPFGRDSESSAALTKALKQYLEEDQIFRIDHYLGKELVENLSVLRFSNLIFEPLWSRQYIRNVQLIFSEDFGTEGRGGYFDNYGIIRDIMQNHLLQILALFAMETPGSLDAEDIRNEKVKILRSMRPLQLENVVTGQYKSHVRGGVTYPAYTDDKTVPKGSLTPTFAAAALFIDNSRWDGVPFLMKAGKALHNKRAEIRVQFRHVPGNLYNRNIGTDLDRATNELVIRVQPDEAIFLKINNKVPGLGMWLDRSNLNLHYAARYSTEIPDAYERLLLDAIEGERRLFIRSDELDAAWSLFTPLLKEIEEKKIIPESYPYGSRGPVGAHYLAARYKVRWGDVGVDQ